MSSSRAHPLPIGGSGEGAGRPRGTGSPGNQKRGARGRGPGTTSPGSRPALPPRVRRRTLARDPLRRGGEVARARLSLLKAAKMAAYGAPRVQPASPCGRSLHNAPIFSHGASRPSSPTTWCSGWRTTAPRCCTSTSHTTPRPPTSFRSHWGGGRPRHSRPADLFQEAQDLAACQPSGGGSAGPLR